MVGSNVDNEKNLLLWQHSEEEEVKLTLQVTSLALNPEWSRALGHETTFFLCRSQCCVMDYPFRNSYLGFCIIYQNVEFPRLLWCCCVYWLCALQCLQHDTSFWFWRIYMQEHKEPTWTNRIYSSLPCSSKRIFLACWRRGSRTWRHYHNRSMRPDPSAKSQG